MQANRAPLPSPDPSIPSSKGAASVSPSLPEPRTDALKPGSQKEIAFINYIDSRIMHINRRFAKKFNAESTQPEDAQDEASGYTHFWEVAEDLDKVVETVWISNTPGRQLPYLLSLAGMVAEFLPAFPFDAAPTTKLVSKLDQAFASLLNGWNNDYSISITDRVRIRSVIESTRLAAIERVGQYHCPPDAAVSSRDTEDEDGIDDLPQADDQHSLDMNVSRMYEQSLNIVGDSLG